MENNKKQQQNFTRSKACQSADSSVRKSSSDLQVNKPWPRNNRRREQPSAPRNDSQRNSKQYTAVKTRPNVDKRPRHRGGGGCGSNGNAIGEIDDGTTCTLDDFSATSAGLAALEPLATGILTKKVQQYADYELNSVYTPGSKKQNLNHLLNFHYAPRESDYAVGLNVFGRGGNGAASGFQRYNQGGGGAARKQKYNKEQFLQANFQFVIKPCAKPSVTASPDTLIDWHLIEQINIQTTEEPQCPICLYPPIAAKLTRCGHAYCWPCILHYLALSDKSWRKCPICYEAIHTADLKSTIIVQQRQINVGDEITFQLMRRKKGSMFIEQFETTTTPENIDYYPLISCNDKSKLFSKFLIAKRADILNIIEREQRELVTDEDPACPEFVFIQQALDLLKERREKLHESATDITEDKIDDNVNIKKETKYSAKQENTIKIEENKEYTQEEIPTDNSPAESVISSEDSVDDLSVINGSIGNGKSSVKYYYFYQAVDGQNIYLHPLNVKMLQACYGSLDRAPLLITSRVLQKEYHSMDEEHRRKFTCLGHLPLTCQFAIMEVDLQPPIVDAAILRLFKDDLLLRKKERQRRERDERKREKQINEINDRQMGKLIASATNLNLTSTNEFPTCGFEDTLPGFGELIGNDAVTVTATANTIPTPKRQATYSAVAVVGESPQKEELWPTLASPSHHNTNFYQELSTWGKPTGAVNSSNKASRVSNHSERSSECESAIDTNGDFDVPFATLHTDLGDVLAMAISQKKQNTAANVAGNKKTKKTKKMQPLFSTGINYNGN